MKKNKVLLSILSGIVALSSAATYSLTPAELKSIKKRLHACTEIDYGKNLQDLINKMQETYLEELGLLLVFAQDEATKMVAEEATKTITPDIKENDDEKFEEIKIHLIEIIHQKNGKSLTTGYDSNLIVEYLKTLDHNLEALAQNVQAYTDSKSKETTDQALIETAMHIYFVLALIQEFVLDDIMGKAST